MKKFLWLLLLIPIFMGKVYASEVYYSEYSSFSNWNEQKVESTDTIKVEEEKRYLWYKTYKELGGYQLYQKDGDFSGECYYTEQTSWSETQPERRDGRVIYTKEQYTYQLAKGVRYIHLTDLKGSYQAIRIPELRVLVNGKEIDYSYTCKGCRENFDQYIHNGIAVENKSYIDNGGSLVIDLGAIYPIHKVELQFYIFDMGADTKTYTLGFSKDSKDVFASKSFSLKFTHTTASQAEYRVHTITNLGISEDKWVIQEVTDTRKTSDFEVSVDIMTKYSYMDKMCRIYVEKKSYAPTYTKEVNGNYIYKDNTKSKLFYRFQTRDKLELDDIPIIQQPNFDFTSLIITSSQPYTIQEEIDWQKNGTYPVTIQVGQLQVTKDVTVQILENDISKYEQEIAGLQEQLNEYQKQISQLQEQWQQERQNYEERLGFLQQQMTSLEQQLFQCQENCDKEKQCLQDLIDEKEALLEEYKQKMLDASTQINQYQLELQKKQEEIISLNKENALYKDQVISLEGQIQKVLQESKKLNEAIIHDYQTQLDKKEDLVNAYIKKIKELSEKLDHMQGNVGQVVEERNQFQKENMQLQKLLKEQTAKNQQIQEKLNQYEQDNTCQLLSEELEISKNEKNNLNQKLNNYILKIQKSERKNLVVMIVFTILLCLFSIYGWRKKSNVK